MLQAFQPRVSKLYAQTFVMMPHTYATGPCTMNKIWSSRSLGVYYGKTFIPIAVHWAQHCGTLPRLQASS